MGMKALGVAAVMVMAGLGAAVQAHHAFAAEFDASRPIHFKAVLKRIEWVNPHSWIHVEVTKPDGTIEKWAIEAGTPNTLFRRGVNRNTMKLGQEVVVDGYQAKNGALRASGRDITFPDGRKFFLGQTGAAAAPGDAAKPAGK